MSKNLPLHLTSFNAYMAEHWHLDWRSCRVSRQYVPISIYKGVTVTLSAMSLWAIKQKWSELTGIHTDDIRIKVFNEVERVVVYHAAASLMGPHCVVRFEDVAITYTRWQRMGSPLELDVERLSELREPETPEAEQQEAESERVSEWLEVGDAVRIAYGEAVELAAESMRSIEAGRKVTLECWEAEARDAEAGTRFSVSGGEVLEY